MPKSKCYPHWKGFEFTPEGCLLEQFIDISGDMGIAYERSCEFYKDFHTHDRLMLIFPRGSSSMEVRTLGKDAYSVDSSTVLSVPKGLEHDDEGMSEIYDTMALYPSDGLIQRLAKKQGLSSSDLSRLKEKCLKLKRSSRLETYAHDYFFERIIAKRSAEDEETNYLAKRILEEVLCILFPACEVPALAQVPKPGTIVERALRIIETRLFEDLQLDAIAEESAASPSTLLRKFKEELKTTPVAYVRNRRLEEAMHLLKAGRTVGDVALLVGYTNFGAFSEAFKEKYNKNPSQVRAPGK